MDRKMEETPFNLNTFLEQASEWTFDGDFQILQWMQNISKNLESKASRTTDNLDRLNNTIKSTNVALDNVANSLTALQFGNQFVECRVQDDDESSTPALSEGVVANGGSTPQSSEKILSKFLDNNLKVLRNCHEKYSIDLEDSDEDDEKFEKTYVFKPVNPYNDKPLPHIFGSREWCEKWHVGLGDDDQDNNYSGDELSEAYSESTATSSPVPDNESYETNSEFASSVSLNNENLERNVKTLRRYKIEAVSETSSNHSSVAKVTSASHGDNNNFIKEIQGASSLLNSQSKTGDVEKSPRDSNTSITVKNISLPPRNNIPPYGDLFADPPDDLGSSSSTPSLTDSRLHNPVNLFSEDVDDVFKHLAIAQSKRNNPLPVPRERTNIVKTTPPPIHEQTVIHKSKENTPEIVKKTHIGFPVLPTNKLEDKNKIANETPSTSLRTAKNIFDDDEDNEDFLSAFVKRDENKTLSINKNIKSLDTPKDNKKETPLVSNLDHEKTDLQNSSKEQNVRPKSKFVNLFDDDEDDYKFLDIGFVKTSNTDQIKNTSTEKSNKASLPILKSTNLFDDEDEDDDFFKTLPRTNSSLRYNVIVDKAESEDTIFKTKSSNVVETIDQSKKTVPTTKTPNIIHGTEAESEDNFFKTLPSTHSSVKSTQIINKKEIVENISNSLSKLPNIDETEKISPTPKISNKLFTTIKAVDEEDDFFTTLPRALSSLKSTESEDKDSKTVTTDELLNTDQSKKKLPILNVMAVDDEEEQIFKPSTSNELPYVEQKKDVLSTLKTFEYEEFNDIATKSDLLNKFTQADDEEEDEFMKSLPPIPKSSENNEINTISSSTNLLKNKLINVLESNKNDDDEFFKNVLSSHKKLEKVDHKNDEKLLPPTIDKALAEKNRLSKNKIIKKLDEQINANSYLDPVLQIPDNESIIKSQSVEQVSTTIRDDETDKIFDVNKNKTILNEISNEEIIAYSPIVSVTNNALLIDKKSEEILKDSQFTKQEDKENFEICDDQQIAKTLEEKKLDGQNSNSVTFENTNTFLATLPDNNISKDNKKSQKYDYNSSFLFDEPPDDDSDFFESLGKASQQSNAKYNSFDLEPDLYSVSQLQNKQNIEVTNSLSSTYAGLQLFDDIPPEDDSFFEIVKETPDPSTPIPNRINSVFYDDFPETLEALNAKQNLTHSILTNVLPSPDVVENIAKDKEELKASSDGDASLSESNVKNNDNAKTIKHPVSKLQIPNININVETLLPFKGGITAKALKTSHNFENKLESQTQPKIEKENTDNIPSSKTSHLLPNVNKNRVRAPINRRPSSRKARQESYRTSMLAEELLNEKEDGKEKENKLTTHKRDDLVSELGNVVIPAPSLLKKPIVESISEEKVNFDRVNIVAEKQNSNSIVKTIPGEITEAEKSDSVLEKLISVPKLDNVTKLLKTENANEKNETQTTETATASMLNVSKSDKVLKSNTKLLFTDSECEDDLFSKLSSVSKIEASQKVTPSVSTKTLESRKLPVNKQPQTSLFGDDSDDDADFLKTTLKSKIVTKSKSIMTGPSKSIFSDTEDSDDEDLFKGKSKVLPQQSISKTLTGSGASTITKDTEKHKIADNPLADLL